MISESSAFHTAIFDALCACLNLSAAEGIKLIHEAYAEPENVPRPPRKRNVIYWTVLQDLSADPVSTEYSAETVGEPPRAAGGGNLIGGEVNRSKRAPQWGVAPTEVAVGTHIPVICSTLKYQLVIVCYGPECEENASRIRSMLFLDGAGFPRQILRAAGIYPVPDPPQPSLLYEEEGSLWRKRADLTVRLRVLDEQQAQARNSISSAPAVIIRKGS